MTGPLILSRYTTVNAVGRGCAETLESLRSDRSGLTPCHFGGNDLDTYVGLVEGLEDLPVVDRLHDFDCRNNRLAQLALRTDGFEEAVKAAIGRYGAHRIATVVGSSTSGVREGELAYEARADLDGPLPDNFCFGHTHDFYSLADFVRRYLRLKGPAATITTACSSSAKAFVDAWQMIETGLCDAAIVGGVDSLTALCLYGFNALELLSPDPCRPNDASRSGISIGEAGGFMLLERPENADGSGAPNRPVGFLGYGESTDAYHMSSPHPEGKGAELAMRQALERAGLSPGDVDYVNFHGTGTVVNDQVEAFAMNAVFGSAVPCSSTKGWTGHTLGAAGITEAVIACLCITESFVPKNLNLREVDPSFECRIVEQTESRKIDRVLSNSFGFGGNNCSLILGNVS